MSQWTPTAMAKEPERERAHSSCSTIVVRRSAPLPPYFSSYSTPRNPSSPRRGQIDRGIRPAASHSDRKSTRLNSSHVAISYAVLCLKKKNLYHTHYNS